MNKERIEYTILEYKISLSPLFIPILIYAIINIIIDTNFFTFYISSHYILQMANDTSNSRLEANNVKVENLDVAVDKRC